MKLGTFTVTKYSKVISDAIIAKIQHAGIDSQRYDKGAFGKRMINELGERPNHNAYQWDFVMEDDDFFKAGINGQGLYISPKKDLVIACYSHGDYTPGVSVAFCPGLLQNHLINCQISIDNG